jgi:hypothetical protein
MVVFGKTMGSEAAARFTVMANEKAASVRII